MTTIIPDREVDPEQARRVVLCTGKVYFDLLMERRERGIEDVALVRIEQLYPLQDKHIQEVLAPYADGTDLVWVQEEPRNSGGWYYINARIPEMIGGRMTLRCVSRPESASPATGSNAAHKLEQKELITDALS